MGGWVINYGWAGPLNLQLITGFDTYNFRHYESYFDLLEGLRKVRGARCTLPRRMSTLPISWPWRTPTCSTL